MVLRSRDAHYYPDKTPIVDVEGRLRYMVYEGWGKISLLSPCYIS
jgi:hypothetical protein